MKLYVMRHGPAEDHSPTGSDADRALSAGGRDRVRSVAQVLTEGGEAPLSILASPLVRAVQTADIVAVGTKLSERGGTVEIQRELTAGGDGFDLVFRLLHQKRKRVMLVGHEPDLSSLVTRLVGEPVPLPMDKAMVVGLRVRAEGKVALRFVLEPRALTWAIDSRK